jgi:hypothetical protein
MTSTITETNIVDQKAKAGPSSHSDNILSSVPGFSRSNTAGESTGQDDLELMTMPSVVGRESGERDPLLLRESIMSDEAIKGLKQSVIDPVSPSTDNQSIQGPKVGGLL